MNLIDTPFFVFDVESVGLYGEGFAVGGGVYFNGTAQSEFQFCCPLEEAQGSDEDRAWVKEHVPVMAVTHRTPKGVREAFWDAWEMAQKRYPGIKMAGECIYPVEAGFVTACINDDKEERLWKGPYPLHDAATAMLMAGFDPMKRYTRTESEKPAHDPLADARQSARLLTTAIQKISGLKYKLPVWAGF